MHFMFFFLPLFISYSSSDSFSVCVFFCPLSTLEDYNMVGICSKRSWNVILICNFYLDYGPCRGGGGGGGDGNGGFCV